MARTAMATGTRVRGKRDMRLDVLRGVALLMIFADHLPGNPLALFTLHNFGFCDAAEVFVLLAGVSAMMAYGKVWQRDGAGPALRKVALRCARIYAWQALLLVTTLAVVLAWTRHFGLKPTLVAPVLDAGLTGVLHGLMLHALPGYLDILPLYIVLLALFPLLYLAMRTSVWLGLGGSLLVWLAANVDRRLTLPNWLDENGWYFNPFTWQLLFSIGMALAIALDGMGSLLPRRRWLVLLCAGYLAFALIETLPWQDWGWSDSAAAALRLVAMAPPDKSRLSPLRLLDIMALFYLLFSDPRVQRLARHRLWRAFEACGKHSLEIFGVGCLLALFGRLALRTWGHGWPILVGVNGIGLACMCLVGLWMDRSRYQPVAQAMAAATE